LYVSWVPSGTQPLSDRSRRVGAVLLDRLKARGIDQVDVAVAVGMSASQLSRCLRGKKPWNLDQLEAVCLYVETNLLDVIAASD
jgi:transcriptional regulator with XRE-family HTH domain